MRTIVVGALVLVMRALAADAATIHVPADQPTVQQGLNAAGAGDTVLLGDPDGSITLEEAGIIMRSGVTLKGASGLADSVIISAPSWPPASIVLYCTSCDSLTRIEGITFRGAATGLGLWNSSPRVSECLITENWKTIGGGGGIMCIGGSPLFTGCRIAGNGAEGGGGVECGGTAAKFIECEFTGNEAYNDFGPSLGGAVIASGSALCFENCLFTGNRSMAGGAVFSWYSEPLQPVEFRNCTFVANEAGDGCSVSGPASISQSIFWDGTSYELSGEIQLACSLVDSSQGLGPDWENIATEGQILHDDPKFCPGGDYRLALNSPCLPVNNECGLLIGALGAGCGPSDYAVLTADGLGDYPTIQEAIDIYEGQYIYLTDGIYSGVGNRDLDFAGRPIKLKSMSGDPSACVIDCQGSQSSPHRGIVFQSGETAEVLVEGISIVNGWAEEGGAVRVSNGSSPILSSCRITGNAAANGGAVHCSGGAAPSFEQTLLAGNEAVLGGSLYVDGAAATFRSCTIADNASPTACVFANASTLSLENTIVAFNAPGASILSVASTASLECCDVYRNEGGDYVYAFAGAFATNGNISVDPLFCSSEPADYTLVPSSICLPGSDYNPCGELIGAYAEGTGCDIVGAEGTPALPAVLALQPNYPNPFNPATEIAFVLPEATSVELAIFDPAGRRVRSLATRVLYAAGSHALHWDGKNDEGWAVPSGAYLCRLQAGAQIETRKLMLLK